jgi:hypothetical protein
LKSLNDQADFDSRPRQFPLAAAIVVDAIDVQEISGQVTARLIEVRSLGDSGLVLLTLSSSRFDPQETSAYDRSVLCSGCPEGTCESQSDGENL